MGFCDGLHEIRTVSEGLGTHEDKVRACGSDGMKSRILKCSFPQHGYGLNPTTVVSAELDSRGGYIMNSEPAQNVIRTSICGNEETLIESLSPVCNNEGIVGEKLSSGKSNCICDSVEDRDKVSSINHIPYNDMYVCDQSRLEHSVGADSLKRKLSSKDNVDKTNSFAPELVSQSLIPVENAKGLDCELNSQKKTANVAADPANIAQPGSCGQGLRSNPTIEDQQDVFGHLSTFTRQDEETTGTQFQYDSKPGSNTMGSLTREPYVVVFGSPAAGNSEFSNVGRRKSYGSPMEKKYPEQSLVNSTRILRPRSQEKPKVPEPSSNLESGKRSTENRRGKKKKTEIEGKSYDEFFRMRKHLRYLLHRIRSEQNLLDAYCSEGWRGQSLEKLRPEKELERAKADINRSKLKIRDLFRHLDSLSAEGRFPDSLFDSEGLIDSEDIFCAKCGTDELSADNDIILCDGVCERGFHQFCLEPPLRTDEIPPGEEGWLCPACDCKFDCVDFLNDSQLTELSFEYNWEKVFPEAIATANDQDDIMGLPSDDSGDDDYNPNGPNDDDTKVEGSGSKSDASHSSETDSSDSDFSFASEDVGALGVQEQNGPPSDDSEDDDYDPNAANVNEDIEKESSSSDFTFAFEDLGSAIQNDRTSGDEQHDLPAPLLETDQDKAELPPLSGRRHVERLDYKKLYDETYADGPSESSDDEEWTDVVFASEENGSSKKGVSDFPDDNFSTFAPRRRAHKKLNPQALNGSPVQPLKSSEKIPYGDKSTKKPHNRLGEIVPQDDIMGLPSDDSGDEDYNPDGPDDDTKVEGSGSRSDSSDSNGTDSSDSGFSSASEDLGALGVQEQNLGQPSDDSEDDDYDPNAANVNDDVEKESSSSDFTSASEDLGATIRNDGTSGHDEHELTVPLLEPDEGIDEPPPLCGRRHVERLDYKKLYEETYANGPSNSDDEEWADVVSASKGKDNSEKGASDSSNGIFSAFAPRKRGRKKLNPQAINSSPAQPRKSSKKIQSGDKSTKRPHNRLGETVLQRLYGSFKENQYPDSLMKEKLANELGITPKQVSKWFESVRWTSKHRPGRLETSMASYSAPPQVASNVAENGSADSSKFDAKECSKIKPTPKRTYRKTKNTEDYQPIPKAQIDSLPTPKAQHRSTRKKRKSSA